MASIETFSSFILKLLLTFVFFSQLSNGYNVSFINQFMRKSDENISRHLMKRSFVFQPGTRFRIKPELLIRMPEVDLPVETAFRLRMPVLDYFYIERPSGGARDFDHAELLGYVENSLDNAGLHGQECISRVICEVMQVPKHSLGFVGELVDIVSL